MRARVASFFLAFALYVLWAEPSVFAEGKKEQNKIQNELYRLSTAVEKLSESQEGMRSLFDSQTKRLQELYSKNQASPFITQSDLQSEFKDLNITLVSHFKEYDESLQTLKTGLESLGELIQTTDAAYQKRFGDLDSKIAMLEESVRERELSKNRSFETNETNTSKSGLSDSKVALDTLANHVVFKEGVALLDKKDLDEAKRYLEHSFEKQYKPATSLFYLGEIAYQQERYDDAITHYKESASRYDKAAYIPILLLHTADSFEKTGDKANAKKFLDTLIQSYSDSKEAKEARKKRSELK